MKLNFPTQSKNAFDKELSENVLRRGLTKTFGFAPSFTEQRDTKYAIKHMRENSHAIDNLKITYSIHCAALKRGCSISSASAGLKKDGAPYAD